MGGAEAEVADDTTEILLESAYFEPSGIARTAKRLGLRSEASARFERGIDPNGTGTGAMRAMELFAEVAAADPRPARSTCTRADRAAAHHGANRARQHAARYRALPATEIRDAARAARVSRPSGDRRRLHRDRADVPARPRPRDRHRRGGRAGASGSSTSARTVPSNPEKIGGAHARSSASGA